ncbi:hypothetical protein JM189_00005 [Wolbachia endosymbiont of Nasonia vitripennis]
MTSYYTAANRHTAIYSIAVRTFIFEGKLHSKWSVLDTGMALLHSN